MKADWGVAQPSRFLHSELLRCWLKSGKKASRPSQMHVEAGDSGRQLDSQKKPSFQTFT